MLKDAGCDRFTASAAQTVAPPCVLVKRFERSNQVGVGELVAFWIDARTEGSGHLAGTHRPHGGDGRLHHAGDDAPPAGMDGGEDPLLAAQRQGCAVCGQHAQRTSGQVRDQAVAPAGTDLDHTGR